MRHAVGLASRLVAAARPAAKSARCLYKGVRVTSSRRDADTAPDMPIPWRLVVAFLLAGGASSAAAQGACGAPLDPAADAGARIAAVACEEHALWYSPFIDHTGRLASMRISESEALRLRDGSTPAWMRVAEYWQRSGVRWPPSGLPAGAECMPGARDAGAALCRVFLIDTPWSAVFVSYVMGRAGIAGFPASARHVDYVREAHGATGSAPYRLVDPHDTAPAVGDLLCFARGSGQVMGHAGFIAWLARTKSEPMAMHCDIVVSAGDGRARLVGGNVLQGVTMRIIPLNRAGRFWGLAQRTAQQAECTPSNASDCNFNRQDWVALMKLDARAAAPGQPRVLPLDRPSCCEVCELPMPTGMRRCTAGEANGSGLPIGG